MGFLLVECPELQAAPNVAEQRCKILEREVSDENVLAEYMDGVLEAKRRHEVEQHVDTCVACRQVVSDLARMQHAVRDHSTAVDAHDPTDNVTLAVGASGGFGSTTPLEAVRHRKRTSHIVPER